MRINLNLDKITASDTVVLANNRQVLAFKNTWALQNGTCALPIALSWGQYLQHVWRMIAVDTHKRLISAVEVRMLVRQSMSECGQAVDNQLLNEVIKNLDYCQIHRIDIKQLSQSKLQSCEHFSAWILRYRQEKRRLDLIDANDLPAYICKHADKIHSPYVYGFKTLTPIQSQLFNALNYQTLNAIKPNTNSQNLTFKTTQDEILSAAQWAKDLHTKSPAQSIAIISPTLNQNHYQIKSIFDTVFDNTLIETGQKAYNISLGLPLPDYPLIQQLLLMLKLAQQLQNNAINTEIFNSVITSPYVAYAQDEASERAILVNHILSLSQINFKLIKIEPLLSNTPRLQQLLETIIAQPKAKQQSLEQWLIDFDSHLICWGFATDRGLSSVEYQLFNKYQQMRLALNSWAGICKDLSASQALNQLQDWLTSTIFQAQGAKTPVQILGTLEAEGLYFDHAWVLDMSADFLPAALNSPYFIPSDIAIKHQIPHSSLALITQDGHNTLANLHNLCDKVICSYAKMHLEAEQQPSPMLSFNKKITFKNKPKHFATRSTLTDTQAQIPNDLNVRGGVKLLQDQMACAFKGFANRLKLQTFDAPHIGLNAAQQGSILHNILAQLLQIAPSRTALLAYSDAQLNTVIDTQIECELNRYAPSGFKQIEQNRLKKILQKFIEMEKQREDFCVIATEQEINTNINGLTFTIRLDRVDKMENGEQIIFDYKTGNIVSNPWCGQPIREAQLPIYALNNTADGVAFIQILADKISVIGLASEPKLLPHKPPKQTKCAEWGEQRDIWKTQLDQASSDYQQGKAQVLPTKGACQYCELDSLCRVAK